MKWRPSVLLLLTGLCCLTHCLTRQYHFIGTAQSWSEAQTYCRERFTDLATISNIEDMNRLVNTAQDSTGGFRGWAWIGLHDNLTSWRWSYSDSRYYGEEEGDYRNWDFGQPDNFFGNQMCVKMWSGGVWDDSQCSLRNPFICYDGTTSTYQRFIFVDQVLSWSDARLYCREHYTDLASVRDEKENQEIQQLAQNRGVWIGLYRTREWSDQSDSTYRYWKQGQPDNVGGKQNCTATDLGNAGLWSDEQCSRELVFICYGENEETPPLSTTTMVTPNEITTITGYLPSTQITSPEQPPTSLVDQISIPDQTSHTSSPSTITTVTPNRRTDTQSTTGSLSTEITSSEQPSTPEVDQTRTITDETPNKPLLSSTTTTTIIPKKITIIEVYLPSPEIDSPEQPSTSLVDQTTSIPAQIPHTSSHSTITTATPDKRTTTEIESTTRHLSTVMTSSKQPSTLEVDQTRPITEETPNKPLLSTTFTPNKITTIDEDSTSAETTSPEQPSASLVDQTTSIPAQTPHTSSQSTITTVNPDKRTTTEIESTTRHLSTVMTSSKQSSTLKVAQTGPITDVTPNKLLFATTTTFTPNKITTIDKDSTSAETTLKAPNISLLSTPTMTPQKRATTEIKSTTDHDSTVTTSFGHPSTPEVDQTGPNKITTIDEDSTSTEITSPEQPSASLVDQTTSTPAQTPHTSSQSTITTVNPDKRTTTEIESTTRHLSTVMTSSKQSSNLEVDQTGPITDVTPNKLLLATTSTFTPNKITTIDKDSTSAETTLKAPNISLLSTPTMTPQKRATTEIKSTTDHDSTVTTSFGHPSTPEVDQTGPNKITTIDEDSTSAETTSPEQPSASLVDQTTSIPAQTPHTSSQSTITTVNPDKRTTTEIESTTRHLSTVMTSSKQSSTLKVAQTGPITDVTPNKLLLATTTTFTPNKITTIDKDSTSTETTSPEQPSASLVDQTTAIPAQTPHTSSQSSITTVNPDKRTTTEIESTTRHLSTVMTSSKQSSTLKVAQTGPITDVTPNKLLLATTSTFTPNKITTIDKDSTSAETTLKAPNISLLSTPTMTPQKRATTEIKSTTDHDSTVTTSFGHPSTPEVDQTGPNKITTIDEDSTSAETTSPEQPSASLVDQTTSILAQTPHTSSQSTITTVNPDKRTTTEIESTTRHLSTVMTSSKQSSTLKVAQTGPITDVTPNKLLLATTTTFTPNKITTIDKDSTSAETTLKAPNISLLSTPTMTPQKRATTEIKSTTDHDSTVTTSFGHPSTPEVDQTGPNKITTIDKDSTSTEITSPEQPSASLVDQTTSTPAQTPHTSSHSTITTVTPNKRTTTEIESTTGHLSAVVTSSKQPLILHVSPTRAITAVTPNQPVLFTTEMTTIEEDSTSREVSSQQYSTPNVDRTGEHVTNLQVKFTSKIPLSEDDIEQLVLVEFHNLLIEMGLPKSIKLGLKRPLKKK